MFFETPEGIYAEGQGKVHTITADPLFCQHCIYQCVANTVHQKTIHIICTLHYTSPLATWDSLVQFPEETTYYFSISMLHNN